MNAPTVESLVALHGGDAVRGALGLSVRWVARVTKLTPEAVRAYERAKEEGRPTSHPKLDELYAALAGVWRVVQ